MSDDLEVSVPGGAKSSTGEGWHSSALTGPVTTKPPTPHPGDMAFQGWRERRWMEGKEGEWSYSTGPGTTTLDILRERFGEASFWDTPSWQP